MGKKAIVGIMTVVVIAAAIMFSGCFEKQMTARETVDRHATAIIEGNRDIVMEAFVPEVAENIQPLADAMKSVQPTTYEIIEERKEGDNWVFKVNYIGNESSLLVKGTWALKGEEWKVIAAEKVKMENKI